MWQTGIIYYGLNLAHYTDREAGNVEPVQGEDRSRPQATVEFWRDLVG
jgi:hypothetical protein